MAAFSGSSPLCAVTLKGLTGRRWIHWKEPKLIRPSHCCDTCGINTVPLRVTYNDPDWNTKSVTADYSDLNVFLCLLCERPESHDPSLHLHDRMDWTTLAGINAIHEWPTGVALTYPAVTVRWVNSRHHSPLVFSASQRHEWRISRYYTIFSDAGVNKSFFFSLFTLRFLLRMYFKQQRKNICPCSKLSNFIGRTICFLIRFKSWDMRRVMLTPPNGLFNSYCFPSLDGVRGDHDVTGVLKRPWHLINQLMWLSDLCVWDIMSSWLKSLRGSI